MSGRDPHEAHRVSTPLELLFDLTFVVAIAFAGAQLHHAVVEHHLGIGLLGYLTVFAAIWWAWMAYTWFASAYDTDDTGFRLLTMLQMVGVLILAAGVPRAAAGDFGVVTAGYVVMRVGLVALWWRVAREHPERRRTAMRFAWGILAVQVLWVARLAAPPAWGMVWIYASWAVLMAADLAVPLRAERVGPTPWHAHHISERYALFTIIVLGECVLGATHAVAGAIDASGLSLQVAVVGGGMAALVLALWWVYFLFPFGDALHHHRERGFAWGYGHFVVFASIAAMGAFLEVVADQLKGPAAALAASAASAAPVVTAASAAAVAPAHAPLSPVLVVGLVAAAVAVYLVAMWAMGCMITRSGRRIGGILAAALAWLAAVVLLVAAGCPLPWSIPLLALAPGFIIVMVERSRRHAPEPHEAH
jgi:low temperature requirement protein LtrA